MSVGTSPETAKQWRDLVEMRNPIRGDHGGGEMAQWLSAHAVLLQDLSLVLWMSDVRRLITVIPATEIWFPLPVSWGTGTCVHILTHRHTI